MGENLKLYNSLSKKVESFKPLKKGKVSIYVCGITPYDTTHLGHAFTYISFDILVRYLAFLGYKVNYVQNVTDVDDDILKRAKEEKRDWQELGNYWTKRFLADMGALNWIMPADYVKATGSIKTIVKIVSALVEKGYAYEREGNVYFEVKKFGLRPRGALPRRGKYGKLSGINREEMIKLSRERGADPEDPNKRDPLDFILWQVSSTPEVKAPATSRVSEFGTTKDGKPFWKAPFGAGRPGWHIECSSMIYDYLGEQIDIHGGGEDLIYPHHESEIAQSESFTNKTPVAKFFLHTGNVFYEGEKMSKSLGNLVMVSDLLKKYSANAIRFLLLSHHYREQWEFKNSDIEQATEKVQILENVIARNISDEAISKGDRNTSARDDIDREFINALDNDLDTPKALEVLPRMSGKALKSCLLILGFQF